MSPRMHVRSRWLKIPFVVVVLIGSLWWVTRSRIDPMFVGEWATLWPHGVPTGRILTLGADGIGDYENESPGSVREDFRWWVSRGSLVRSPVARNVEESIVQLVGLDDRVSRMKIRVVEAHGGQPMVVELLDSSGSTAMLLEWIVPVETAVR